MRLTGLLLSLQEVTNQEVKIIIYENIVLLYKKMLRLVSWGIFLIHAHAWSPNKWIANTFLSTSLLLGNVGNNVQDQSPQQPVSSVNHVHTFKPPANGGEGVGSSVSVSDFSINLSRIESISLLFSFKLSL